MKTACSLKKQKQEQKTKENTNKQQEIKINKKNTTKEQKSATASTHQQVFVNFTVSFPSWISFQMTRFVFSISLDDYICFFRPNAPTSAQRMDDDDEPCQCD